MSDSRTNTYKVLMLGIGNSGRADDGLGWKFIDRIGELGLDFLDLEYRYQLQVEDAALVAEYDTVLFVDASHEEIEEGYEFRHCIAANKYSFSTHAQEPGAILYLVNDLYNKYPNAYILAIAGEQWDLGLELSSQAEENLQAALSFCTKSFIPSIQPEAAI